MSWFELFATSQSGEWVWMWGVVCYKSVEWVGVDVRSCLLQVSQVNRLEELFATSWLNE